jgi:hypothetical protein
MWARLHRLHHHLEPVGQLVLTVYNQGLAVT